MRMLFAAYRKPPGESLSLSEAFQTTISDSRREEFERVAGRGHLTDADVDSFREQVQIELAQRVQPPVLIKTHNARVRHNGYPLIRRELTLGAIYIVRNPLNVVDSVADHWGCSIDQAVQMLNFSRHSIGGRTDKMVRQYLRNWSMHVLPWIDQPAFPTLLLRYEDMLVSAELTLRNVLTFLGWPIDSDRIANAIEQTRFEKLQQLEASEGFAECSINSTSGRFFRKGKRSDWSSVLAAVSIAAGHVSKIIATHGQVMQRLGYPIDVYSNLEVPGNV